MRCHGRTRAHTLQAIDDDGVFGIVTIGSTDGDKVEAARERILMIVDPPKAEVGATYAGRVVNITKFGAFVNILPGRDGLVHISKLGRGKRIDKVEDVVNLGDELEVRVDDIDQNGKLSLSLAGDEPAADAGSGAPSAAPVDGDVETVSFESAWNEQAAGEFGDLGPAAERGPAPSGERRGGDRNRRRGGGGRRN